MAIDVWCKDFPPHLSTLNGRQTLKGSKAKILLAALTCGYDGFFQQFGENWLNRVLHITGNVFPYVRVNSGGVLALDPYYLATDRSESTQGIYYIGQALTKLFAQEFLKAPIVLHASRCSWAAAKGNASKAPHIALKRQEADLFAFAPGAVHVLEAKGRAVKDGSGTLNTSKFNSALTEALVQVSAVALVNGTAPASRSACVWTLCTSGIRGDIVDPDGDGLNAIVSEIEILRSNYALFIDADAAAFRTDILPGYSLIPLEMPEAPHTYIGVLSEILGQLRTGRPNIRGATSLAASATNQLTSDRRVEFLDDGTVLFNADHSRFFGTHDIQVPQEMEPEHFRKKLFISHGDNDDDDGDKEFEAF